MAETLKNWLRKLLGIQVDLRPEVFGDCTKDGTLLANILYRYDIINKDQLSRIIETSDSTICRTNLKYLRIWLDIIGVTCSDHCMDEICCGKGTTALKLFYEVYLSLESNASSRFIAQQKVFISTSEKFDVRNVAEDLSARESPEHPVAKVLLKNADTIEWHRRHFKNQKRTNVRVCDKDSIDVRQSAKKGQFPDATNDKFSEDYKPVEWEMDKLKTILDACKHEREKFNSARERAENEKKEKFLSEMRKKESAEVDKFSRKHRVKSVENVEDIFCRHKSTPDLKPPAVDPEAANKYVQTLTNRTKKGVNAEDENSKLHKLLLGQVWGKFLEDQDEEFKELLARRAIDHSRYEKQMISKLSQVRMQKSLMIRNRKLAEEKKQDLKERELRLQQRYDEEAARRRAEELELEQQRHWEQRQRDKEEKIRNIKENHRRVCLELLYDLIDLAIISAKYREINNEELPKKIWDSWIRLLLQGQSTMDIVKASGLSRSERRRRGGGEEEEEMQEDDILMKIVRLEHERNDALDEADFQDYHKLEGPWREHVPEVDQQTQEILILGSIVLGYMVHRLLEFIYPYPSERIERPVPKVKVSAIVTGIVDQTHCETIQKLLNKSEIEVVRMEDAINYCLQKYKDEMRDFQYIDFSLAKAQPKRRESQKSIRKAKVQRVRSEKSASRRRSSLKILTKTVDDKQTQTPREIPYDDVHPVLSDAAYVGKWTHEFLTLGQQISNELNTKILSEYLKSLKNVQGWVLIDYPNTYEQMARLESALTGQKVAPKPNLRDLQEDEEVLDPTPPKIVFKGEEVDDFASCRQSKLLPNPLAKTEEYLEGSFVRTYVKVTPKPKNMEINENEVLQVLPEDSTSIDDFYANRNIAHVIYYTTLDLQTLKEIARVILGDFSLPRKSSVELFGDILKDLEGDRDSERSSTKESMVKQLIPRPSRDSRFDEDEENDEDSALYNYSKPQPEKRIVKPGDEEWEWVDFPQDRNLFEIIATAWENIEDTYIDNVKDVLFLKRIYLSAIVPYKSFIMTGMKRFIARPDVKQDLLDDFHREFNDIEEDTREDEEMKCELHCRVDDLRTVLWNVCDDRKHEAEEERRRLINDHWTHLEAMVLVNVYIGILQVEVDRFIDTMQLIQDYYLSMFQKPLNESRFPKVTLNSIQIKDDSFKESQEPNSKSKKDSTSAPLHAERNLFKEEIADILSDIENSSFNPSDSFCYKTILANIEFVQKTVDSVSIAVMDILKKEESIANKSKMKIQHSRKSAELSADSLEAKLIRRGKDLVEEWRYAALFEVNRMLMRLEILNRAAKADVTFLLETMRQMFHETHKLIIERYKREVESVNEAVTAFCYAIENAAPIQEEMSFDGDRFVVHSSVLMFPDRPKSPAEPVEEVSSTSEFRMAHLGRLHDTFKRIAPQGHMAQVALIYLLQDFVSLAEAEEEGDLLVLPAAWYKFDPCDIRRLVIELFGLVDRVNWREFIIYAMALPMPTQEEILRQRADFRADDPTLSETVTQEKYHATPLWFYEGTLTSPEAKHILYEDFERDDEESDFYLNDESHFRAKVTGMIVPDEARKVPRRSVQSSDSVIVGDVDELSPEDTARMILAKELLCQLFLVGKNTVNYTALLLTFCKDEDPRDGFAKALSLVIGSRICTDVEEGEKYVESLYQLRHQYGEEESLYFQQQETLQIVCDIVQELIELSVKPKTDAKNLFGVSENRRNTNTYSKISNEKDIMNFLPEKNAVVYSIPKNVCLTVLTAALPWHASQADLFCTSMDLRQLVDTIYSDLQDPEVGDAEETVLAHRLLNHSLMLELLNDTTKFTNKNISKIADEILKDKNNAKNDH